MTADDLCREDFPRSAMREGKGIEQAKPDLKDAKSEDHGKDKLHELGPQTSLAPWSVGTWKTFSSARAAS